MNASFYNEIKKILISARNKVYQTANFAMVEAYWNIGKSIIEEQGGNEKAEYGTGLLKELSKQMTQDFGKGFTVANLKNMRQFYLTFPNGYALRSELSWTHYWLLMRVENENAREFYMQEASYNFKPQIIDFWTFSLNSYLITSAKVHEHSLYQVLNS